MNKKLNSILNIIEIISIFVIAISMIALAKISIEGLNVDLAILKKGLFVACIISEILIIGIELLLFIVYKKNIKYMYIAYMIGEIALAVLVNMYIPFAGLIVIGVLELVKCIIRYTNIVKIYNKRVFNKYCKLFNIKLTTVTATRKKKKKTTRKRVTTTSNKTLKSYA